MLYARQRHYHRYVPYISGIIRRNNHAPMACHMVVGCGRVALMLHSRGYPHGRHSLSDARACACVSRNSARSPYRILYYALDPKARVNIPPHTVGCDGHTLSISEYAAPQPDSDEENDNVDTTPQAESTSPDDAPVAVSKIPLSSLYGMRHSRGNICINLDNRIIPPMLIIPYTAFPSSASLREFLAMIKN